jgi:hypothetical protein
MLVLNAVVRDNERRMEVDMRNDAAEMLEAAGYKDIRVNSDSYNVGNSIHDVARRAWARIRKKSVLNKYNQVHACKNVTSPTDRSWSRRAARILAHLHGTTARREPRGRRTEEGQPMNSPDEQPGSHPAARAAEARGLVAGRCGLRAALAFPSGMLAPEETAGAPANLRVLDAADCAGGGHRRDHDSEDRDQRCKGRGRARFHRQRARRPVRKADQQRFKAGLAEFDAAAMRLRQAIPRTRRGGAGRFVRGLLEAALSADHDPKPFILMTRELALLGYFTSKVGITENMEYVPVPTAFHGCVPLSKMNKPVYWE